MKGVFVMDKILWMIVGAVTSYFLSGKVRDRYGEMAATIAWYMQQKELFEMAVVKQVITWHLEGKLKDIIAQGVDAVPSEEFKQACYLQFVQDYANNKALGSSN